MVSSNNIKECVMHNKIIKEALTYDDVLLKIHRKGMNSLCEFEKNVLDKYCNSL